MPHPIAPDLQEACSFVHANIDQTPDIALILGSGLGSMADAVENAAVIGTADIPGYPTSTVAGHAGRLVFGTLEGRNVVVVQGRVHYYEGHSAYDVVFPIRLLHALGVTRLVVTNAAGGINRTFEPGTLMWIEDHVNLSFANPLVGPVLPGAPRFPDMSAPYDLEWTRRAQAEALRLGIRTRTGVYLWTAGPSYESQSEIRMFERLGADAVGMSTVPEVLTAGSFGMKVLGISTITNAAAGLGNALLSHEEVLEVGRRMAGELEQLLKGALRVA